MEAAKVIQLDDQLMVKEFDIQEITEKNLSLMKKQILEIPETPKSKEQYDKAYRFHVDSKALLPRIEDRRVELKAPVLEKGRNIDATAKKAKEMVQPLIELSGSRRFAWEDIKAKEKADKEAAAALAEKLHAGKIQWHMDGLELACSPLEYGLSSEKILGEIRFLEEIEISVVDFDTRTEEAEQKRFDAIQIARTAYEAALKFEADQAEAARVAKENARIAEENAAKEKELAEAQAKLEASRKAQDDVDRKAREAEEETRRQEAEALKAEREALEKEKAELAHKAIVVEREAVWEVAHRDDFNRDHSIAIARNERFKRAVSIGVDNLRSLAEKRWQATEKAKAEKAAREKLIGPDKMMLTTIATDLENLINDYEIPTLNTKEANDLVLDVVASLRTRIWGFEQKGAALV